MRLAQDFFDRHVIEVARDLIGKSLIFDRFKGIITETEAYRGSDDEASHAARGVTPRSKIMFGPSGMSYVYFIYGMYYCLNVVAEEEGSPAAVLIRGLRMADIYLNGPGKLCKHLGITKHHNGINLLTSNNFYIEENEQKLEYKITKRVGIKKATTLDWRFVAKV